MTVLAKEVNSEIKIAKIPGYWERNSGKASQRGRCKSANFETLG